MCWYYRCDLLVVRSVHVEVVLALCFIFIFCVHFLLFNNMVLYFKYMLCVYVLVHLTPSVVVSVVVATISVDVAVLMNGTTVFKGVQGT